MKPDSRFLLSLVVLAATASAFAQTPPIKPQTPDVVVTPALVLPLPPGRAVKTLSADEAVSLALRQLPALVRARADVAAAGGRAEQSRAGLSPSLSVSGGASHTDTLAGSSVTAGSVSTSLTLQQLLFDFERTRSQAAQGRSDQQAAEFGLAGLEQGVVLLVRNAYYAWNQNRNLVGVSDRNLTNRKRQLDLAEARLDSGLGAPGDFLRAKTNYADAVLSMESARRTAMLSQIALAELLGEDPRTSLLPSEQPALETMGARDLNALVDQALGQRPEVLQVEAKYRSAGYSLRAAQSINAPRISASSTLSGRGETNLAGSQTGSWGLSLTWNLLDGGLARGRSREARAQQQAAESDLVAVRHTVISDVSNAFVELDTAERRSDTANAQVQIARELLRVSEGRYQGGIGQFLEVTDAQNLLFSAERTLVQTESDVRTARAQLERAIGTK